MSLGDPILPATVAQRAMTNDPLSVEGHGSTARGFAPHAGLDLDPAPYADPVFTPGMVVCAAARDRNDMRTWEAFQPEDAAPGEWWFDPLWRTTVACGWDKRVDLPSRLAVVDGCGFARGSA